MDQTPTSFDIIPVQNDGDDNDVQKRFENLLDSQNMGSADVVEPLQLWIDSICSSVKTEDQTATEDFLENIKENKTAEKLRTMNPALYQKLEDGVLGVVEKRLTFLTSKVTGDTIEDRMFMRQALIGKIAKLADLQFSNQGISLCTNAVWRIEDGFLHESKGDILEFLDKSIAQSEKSYQEYEKGFKDFVEIATPIEATDANGVPPEPYVPDANFQYGLRNVRYLHTDTNGKESEWILGSINDVWHVGTRLGISIFSMPQRAR